MTTVGRVKAVCKSKKIAISTLERELGFSNGYIGKLKKGVFPDDRLVEIAKFLGVSVSYLTGWDDAVSNLTNAGMSEIDVAEEMGIDPSVMNDILSGNDSSSAAAVSKFARVASLLSEQKEKSPTPEGVELSLVKVQLIEKIKEMDDSMVDALNNLADQILSAQGK